jgi:hypothetical protein
LTSKGFYIRTGRTKNILERTFLSLLEVCCFAECSGKPADLTKPFSPGMIWRDEYCEPYDESSSNHSLRTRDQAISTKDDVLETENYPNFSNDDSSPEMETYQ